MVGTPAVQVTFSPERSASRPGPSRFGPGKTCLAPTIVQVNGNPQALTWNIGTTGMITSLAEKPIESGSAEIREWSTMARWL